MLYKVYGLVTVSAWTRVEASSQQEAEKMTMGRDAALCPYGLQSGEDGSEQAIIEYADGSFVPSHAEVEK